MLFKRFDVDVNWVQIDDDVIPRPAYISVSEWQGFWEACREGDTWQEGYDIGYQTGLSEGDKEHRDDIAHLQGEHEREISRLEAQIDDAESEAYERGRRDGIIEGRLDSLL